MKKHYFLLGLMAFVFMICGAKTSGQIAAWNNNALTGTTSGDLNATSKNANLNTAILSRGAGIAPASLGGGYSSTNWVDANQVDAITNNRYYQVTISAATNYQVSLSTLDFKLRRTSSGPNAYIWRYSIDGVNFANIGSAISFTTTTSGGDVQPQVNLTVYPALQNVQAGTSITLRLYAWGATGTSGSLAFGTGNVNSLAFVGAVVANSTDYFRSLTSGPWNAKETWQSSPDNTNWFNATIPPNSDANIITIQEGHTVTVQSNVSIDQTFVNPKGTLAVGSGITLTVLGDGLTVQSTNNGSGRIGQSAGTISGNVTVERYITAKAARKNVFLASPVSQLISDAWQQQIHITGSGTGGTACDPANPTPGSSQPTPHTNGFDATQTNNPSFFTYNGSNLSGSRWTSIASTIGTSLTPGQGYRVIVRGARSQGCAVLINSAADPTSVTLSAMGAMTLGVNMGPVQKAVINGFTFLGNPYPSEINFTNFRAGNSGIITNKYWTYNPANNAGVYSIYEIGNPSGTVNFPVSPYDPNIIASGQSFFVQSTVGGNVNFEEAHKSAASQTGLFRTTSYKNYIRTALKTSDNAHIDEIVVRFSDEGNYNYDANRDAVSLNDGSQYITSLKSADRLAIQTRPEVVDADTVALRIVSSTPGNFKLNFSEYEAFFMVNIYLKDKLTGVEQNVKTNPVYDFQVTTDAASQGDGRFSLIFSTAATLPVDFIKLTAVAKQHGVDVEWQVPSETNVSNYKVERSEDGRTFKQLSEIKSRGNSASAATYNYSDAKPVEGVGYYRIKATSVGGESKYSSVAKVSVNKKAARINIYPNPVKDVLNLVLGTSADGYNVRVLDGKGVRVLQVNKVSSTNNVLTINTTSLSKGVYMVEVIAKDGQRETARFVKQ